MATTIACMTDNMIMNSQISARKALQSIGRIIKHEQRNRSLITVKLFMHEGSAEIRCSKVWSTEDIYYQVVILVAES